VWAPPTLTRGPNFAAPEAVCFSALVLSARQTGAMNPSTFPEAQGYPRLQRMLAETLDLHFADVRVMLRLPKTQLPAGCNFAIAAVLFNVIAGTSVCIYKASLKGLLDRSQRGARFQALLRGYFPWTPEDVPPDEGIAALYDFSRNPLAHALGVDLPGRPDIILEKGKRTLPQVRKLEDSRRGRHGLLLLLSRTTTATTNLDSRASTGASTGCCTPSSVTQTKRRPPRTLQVSLASNLECALRQGATRGRPS
jgi:hypothetical protein